MTKRDEILRENRRWQNIKASIVNDYVALADVEDSATDVSRARRSVRAEGPDVDEVLSHVAYNVSEEQWVALQDQQLRWTPNGYIFRLRDHHGEVYHLPIPNVTSSLPHRHKRTAVSKNDKMKILVRH